MNKIKVLKNGSEKAIDFTIRFFVFDPKKHFISTPEAKDLCRKQMHCSKKKMDEEYDAIYGVWVKVGRGKNKHIEFNRSTKMAANCIFIVPKKYRSRTWYVMKNLEMPYDVAELKGFFK